MITYSHLYTTAEDFSAFLEETNIAADRSMLVRVHTTVHKASEMAALLDMLRSRLPYARIVGCSSPSVIFHGRRRTNVCMISITDVDDCDLSTASLPCFTQGNTQVPGDELARQLCRELNLYEKNGQMVIFLPQDYFQCTIFAETVSNLAPGIRMIGGIADDAQVSLEKGTELHNDFTFTEYHCGHSYLSAAVIASPQLRCCETFALGMDKITGTAPVTSYHDNIICSVADKRPSEWLRELAGEYISAEDSDVIRIFPIYRKSNDLCGFPVYFINEGDERGSVMIVDSLKDGEEVGIGYLDTNLVVDEVVHMYRQLKSHPIETLFVYSCTLRAEILQNCSEWELEPLTNTCASGAFLGGEFFHDGERNHFGNCNVVISALATKETYLSLNTSVLNHTHHLYHDNEHLVDFLTTSALVMRGGNKISEEMYSRLYVNESIGLGNMSKLFYDIQVKKMNKLCMMSVRNASELVAYAGYKAYGQMINAIVEKIQRFFDHKPMQYYMTEQGDVMVAANNEISAPEFEEEMRQLYDYLQVIEYSRMLPVFEFCLVLDADNHLVRNAKVVQSVLRTRKDLRFLVYSSDMGMEESSVHDVQMVQVINDAIAHGRVIPFYQGIYDNTQKKITMYESLMRLTDADGRIYFPNEFFPVAKKYGLYGHLSRQMVDKVMQNFEEKKMQVTINLSMQDIMDAKMTEMIYGHMKHSRYPEKYVFEVVESEDINDYDAIGAFAEQIHAYGGKLALDDFGSGFSNLIHVLRLDLDYLKVDGGIIRKVCEDEDCRQLLELVSVFCRMREKKVIAEFVENMAIQEAK